MKPKYCPLDNSELQFGGEFAGFYLACPTCSILYAFRENIFQKELIQEAIYMTQNKFKRLKETGYINRELSKIKELVAKAKLDEQLISLGN